MLLDLHLVCNLLFGREGYAMLFERKVMRTREGEGERAI